MIKALLTVVAMACVSLASGQPTAPVLPDSLLLHAQPKHARQGKPFQAIVYGGVNCGFARVLIENIDQFGSCAQWDVVVVLTDSRETILKTYPLLARNYPVFSNQEINWSFKKDDISPQTFLFREG
ncbi:MAG: hypothetical protein MUC38_00835 [Cyclobacteriaceae bacterium]|jgi:hypothetical protein|nr:hypothetical protein [Cyclobacteriaceae bacterium]